ncbi:MAG: LysM peptidoglycan-binding domain-containing protein [Sphingomonadales bacterium]
MNRIIILASALALVAACGEADETTAPTPAPAVAQAPPAPPAPAPAPPPPVVEEPEPTTYMVVRGDTLYGIARAHGVSPADLARWNDLANADLLMVGQELVVAAPE